MDVLFARCNVFEFIQSRFLSFGIDEDFVEKGRRGGGGEQNVLQYGKKFNINLTYRLMSSNINIFYIFYFFITLTNFVILIIITIC
jgi:hypothetical protein